MRRDIEKRLERVEAAFGAGEELPTLFVGIEDASVPDPDLPSGHADVGDAAVIGVIESAGRGRRISRRPDETLRALEKRAGRAMPECRVFWVCYSTIEHSKAMFDRAIEAT